MGESDIKRNIGPRESKKNREKKTEHERGERESERERERERTFMGGHFR